MTDTYLLKLDKGLKQALRRIAWEQRKSIAQLIREMLAEGISKAKPDI